MAPLTNLRRCSAIASQKCPSKPPIAPPHSSSALSFLLRCRFTTGTRRVAKSVVRAKPLRTIRGTTQKQPAVKPSQYESTLTILAKKSSPTLLYQASSHLPYILGCYFAGGGIIAMGAFNGYTNFSVPKSDLTSGRDVPRHVPIFVNIGSFFMIAVGTYLCLRVSRILEYWDHHYTDT